MRVLDKISSHGNSARYNLECYNCGAELQHSTPRAKEFESYEYLDVPCEECSMTEKDYMDENPEL